MKIASIMRHEWRVLRAERAIPLFLGITGVLMAYGIYNGASWVRFQRSTIGAEKAEEKARLTDLANQITALNAGHVAWDRSFYYDRRNPPAVNSAFGYRWSVLPAAPLAALSVGQSDILPYYALVTVTPRYASPTFDELQNPLQLMAGRFDLAFVIVYLFPLLIFALSYNLLSAERENGTLAMVLSQPVALRDFVLGKVAVRALFLLASVIAVSLILIIAIGNLNLAAPGVFGRLALWVQVVAAYGLFWFAVAMIVGVIGRSSAANAFLLAGVWLVFVAVLPSVLNTAISAFYPLPSRVSLVEASHEALGEAQRRGQENMKDYFKTHVPTENMAMDLDERTKRSLEASLESEKQIEPLVDRFDRVLAQQQDKVKQLRFLSPAIVAQLALNEIAGTSGSRYRDFVAQCEEFRGEWRRFFFARYYNGTQFTAADVDRIPEFQYRDQPEDFVTGRVLSDSAFLLISTLSIAGLALLLIPFQSVS